MYIFFFEVFPKHLLKGGQVKNMCFVTTKRTLTSLRSKKNFVPSFLWLKCVQLHPSLGSKDNVRLSPLSSSLFSKYIPPTSKPNRPWFSLEQDPYDESISICSTFPKRWCKTAGWAVAPGMGSLTRPYWPQGKPWVTTSAQQATSLQPYCAHLLCIFFTRPVMFRSHMC